MQTIANTAMCAAVFVRPDSRGAFFMLIDYFFRRIYCVLIKLLLSLQCDNKSIKKGGVI